MSNQIQLPDALDFLEKQHDQLRVQIMGELEQRYPKNSTVNFYFRNPKFQVNPNQMKVGRVAGYRFTTSRGPNSEVGYLHVRTDNGSNYSIHHSEVIDVSETQESKQQLAITDPVTVPYELITQAIELCKKQGNDALGMNLMAYVVIAEEGGQSFAQGLNAERWIPVGESLPVVEPNTTGEFCEVLTADGYMYHAYYCHDVEPGVDTKYWSGVDLIANDGSYEIKNEWYEISKVTHWRKLPNAPVKGAS